MTGPDGSAEPSGPVVRRKERVMENPTLGRIEAEYLNGVRSGNVRKKRLRNRNRRIRRDRASGMSYIDLGAKYELSRAILHQIINRRWRRPPVQLASTVLWRAGHYVRTYSAKVCASTARSELLTMFWPPSTASRETSFTSSFTTCAQAPPA